MKPPVVIVEWIDARDIAESCPYEPDKIAAIATLVRRETSGFLVYQDKNRTVLAHDYDGDENPPEVGNFTVLPTEWVNKIMYKSRKPREPKK